MYGTVMDERIKTIAFNAALDEWLGETVANIVAVSCECEY